MGFKVGSLFYLAVTIICSQEYQLKCPESLHWQLAAKQCQTNSTYLCMQVVSSQEYRQICSEVIGADEIHRDGYKYVLMPNPNPEQCDANRYQPFTFSANSNSQCEYQKSDCNEEGQVVADNRTSSLDRTCRCDYTRGYRFTVPTKDKCSCIPSEEDCSCIYQPCPKKQERLADYRCEKSIKNILPQDVKCPTVDNRRNDFVKKEISCIKLDDIGTGITKSRKTTLIKVVKVVILISAFLIVLFTFGILNAIISIEFATITSTSGLKFKDTDHSYTVIEGDTVSLKFIVRSLFPVTKIEWQKVEDVQHIVIVEDVDKYKTKNDRNPSLVIKSISIEDSGTYRCVIQNGFLTFDRIYAIISRLMGEKKIEIETCITIKVLDLQGQEKHVQGVFGEDAVIEGPKKNTFSSILWVKSNKSPNVIDISNSEKYKQSNDTSSLIVKNCDLSDTADYLCLVTNHAGILMKDGCSLAKLQVFKNSIYKEVEEHQNNQLFVQITAVDNVVEGLDKSGIVVIFGRKGTGKSTLCLEVANRYQSKGVFFCKIDKSVEINANIFKNNILYIIDDDEFQPLMIVNILKRIRTAEHFTGAKVIATCKINEKYNLKKILAKDNCNCAIVDLDALDENEKRYIFLKYMEGCSAVQTKKLSDKSIDAVVKSNPFYGFPLTCFNFFESNDNLNLCVQYFNTLPDIVVEDIRTICLGVRQDTNRERVSKYAVLLYILQNDNKQLSFDDFDIDEFKQIDSVIEKINNSVSLEKESMREAAVNMVHPFLVVVGHNNYEFVHPLLVEAVKQHCTVDKD